MRKALTLAEIAMSLVLTAMIIGTIAAAFGIANSKREEALFNNNLSSLQAFVQKLAASKNIIETIEDFARLSGLSTSNGNQRIELGDSVYVTANTYGNAANNTLHVAMHFRQVENVHCNAIINKRWGDGSRYIVDVGADNYETSDPDDCELLDGNQRMRVRVFY